MICLRAASACGALNGSGGEPRYCAAADVVPTADVGKGFVALVASRGAWTEMGRPAKLTPHQRREAIKRPVRDFSACARIRSRQDQAPMRYRGVGPCIAERAETGWQVDSGVMATAVGGDFRS
jgi:hypothetical protein